MVRIKLSILIPIFLYSVQTLAELAPIARPLFFGTSCFDFLRTYPIFFGINNLIERAEPTSSEIDLYFIDGKLFTSEALVEIGKTPGHKKEYELFPNSGSLASDEDYDEITSMALNHFFEEMLGEKVNLFNSINLGMDLLGGDSATTSYEKAIGRTFGTAFYLILNAINVTTGDNFWPRKGKAAIANDSVNSSGYCYIDGLEDEWVIRLVVDCKFGNTTENIDAVYQNLPNLRNDLIMACEKEFDEKQISIGQIHVTTVKQNFEYNKMMQKMSCDGSCNYHSAHTK